MTMDSVSNLCEVVVSGTYDATATAITLLPTDPNLGRIPTPPFDLLWFDTTHYPNPANDPKAEFVRVTAKPTSNTLTVTRGQQGTAGSTKDTAGATYVMVRAFTALDAERAAASRMAIDDFYQDNVAASQTDVQLSRLANPSYAPGCFIPVRAGSIVGLAVRSSENRTAGTLTVEVEVEGVKTGFTATLDAVDTFFAAETQDPDVDTFLAGKLIYVRITTSADWAPTTADIRVTVEVED